MSSGRDALPLSVVTEGTSQFSETLDALGRRGETDLVRVEAAVRDIVQAVRRDGDGAIRRFVRQFEARDVGDLLVRDFDGAAALGDLDPRVSRAMTVAASRIREYHQRQKEHLTGFEYEKDGVVLASRVAAIERVGVYAPGGKARYPSSVLMSAIPAQVAGVPEIIVATPAPGPEVRAACHLAGVTAILDAGGAHAIAALAYGTQSVPGVDKIVGPGNIYVAAAKRLVFGRVAIDSIAGPTEILVLADDGADPRLLAADLLSQAEHDEAAYPLLACTSSSTIDAVQVEVTRQLADLPRSDIAGTAIRDHGVALLVEHQDGLLDVANRIAAEHVAVHTRDPRALADRISHAGAIFVGPDTPEAVGDYMAGPSHVLPTGGSARFDAPLGVYDFLARTSIISYGPDALASQADDITAFARAEGLEGHARAVDMRTRG